MKILSATDTFCKQWKKIYIYKIPSTTGAASAGASAGGASAGGASSVGASVAGGASPSAGGGASPSAGGASPSAGGAAPSAGASPSAGGASPSGGVDTDSLCINFFFKVIFCNIRDRIFLMDQHRQKHLK